MNNHNGSGTEIEFLTTDDRWIEGFEAGMVYTLMHHRVPVIFGAYHRKNDEYFHLLSSRMGYGCEWEPLDDERVKMCFTLTEDETNGG